MGTRKRAIPAYINISVRLWMMTFGLRSFQRASAIARRKARVFPRKTPKAMVSARLVAKKNHTFQVRMLLKWTRIRRRRVPIVIPIARKINEPAPFVSGRGPIAVSW